VTQQDQDARFWFIEGEFDAIALKSPQHPQNPWYMAGFHDAKYELSLGRNCWRFTEQGDYDPVGETEF
jgi:hypothetical protein